jgi:hypothetical protein
MEWLLMDDFWDDIGKGISGVASGAADLIMPGTGKLVDVASDLLPWRDMAGWIGVPERKKNLRGVFEGIESGDSLRENAFTLPDPRTTRVTLVALDSNNPNAVHLNTLYTVLMPTDYKARLPTEVAVPCGLLNYTYQFQLSANASGNLVFQIYPDNYLALNPTAYTSTTPAPYPINSLGHYYNDANLILTTGQGSSVQFITSPQQPTGTPGTGIATSPNYINYRVVGCEVAATCVSSLTTLQGFW